MTIKSLGIALFLAVGISLTSAALAPVNAQQIEQFFCSVFLDKKKIGTFHVRMTRGATGDIEELRTRASVSMIGVKLYEFSHDVTQTWKGGNLQDLLGRSNDDGTNYDVTLNRGTNSYSGTMNGKAVSVPIEAFPANLWHHGIVDHTLLFSEVDLKLLKVKIERNPETIELHGAKIKTEKVRFVGDFNATVWFDDKKKFVKGETEMKGRKVRLVVDRMQ